MQEKYHLVQDYKVLGLLRTHAIEAEDVVAHRAGPPALHLVLVAEQPLASVPSPVVQLPVCQNAQ